MADNLEEQETENPVVCETYTIPETGTVLGIGRNAAYQAAKTGQIPTIRFGRRLIVPKPWLRRLLEGD